MKTESVTEGLNRLQFNRPVTDNSVLPDAEPSIE